MSEVLETGYQYIIVESYHESGSGLHGDVHVRPIPGQEPYKTFYRVGCSHELFDPKVYPVGTKFRIRAKVTNRQGSPYIYSNPTWHYDVIEV